MAKSGLTKEQLFWLKVDKHGLYPKPYTKVKTRCWQWTANVDRDGYGNFHAGYKQVKAHRFAYELAYGKGCLAKHLGCHKCDNPSCVRPSHMFKGNALLNARDRDAKGRTSHVGAGANASRPGVLNGNAKLTEKQVLKIRALYNFGELTQYDIATRFGVCQGLITAIIRRKLWKQI